MKNIKPSFDSATDLYEVLGAQTIGELQTLKGAASNEMVRRSDLKREIAANGRSPQAYAMIREYTAKRRILAALSDIIAGHPETAKIAAREHGQMRREAAVAIARRGSWMKNDRRIA